jgi:hypothetical protein
MVILSFQVGVAMEENLQFTCEEQAINCQNMKVDSKALFISIDGASMRGLIYLL